MAGELFNPFRNSNLASVDREGQEASNFGASSLLNLADDKLPVSKAFRERRGGAVDGEGGKALAVEGTDSIFNPFYIFRYAKFGEISGKSYDPTLHRDIKPLSGTVLGPVLNFFNERNKVENPSASTIIDWSQTVTDDSKKSVTLGPTPYQWSDFLWCKWYGKIPNNRLLTLRRYPIPVEDNIQIAEEKMPLIPIAQAVTWWGEETGNTLAKILDIDYGFQWDEVNFGDVQNVHGNEVEGGAVLDAFGLTENNVGENTRQLLLASLFDNPNNPFQSTGLDKDFQKWIEDAYGSEGPYWNRVLGPVNVIDKTQIRKRGYSFSNTIDLTFSYKLRAYSQVNPKIAFLDLISNFLSLTHNNAEFYGGAIRYFQKTGYIVPGLKTSKFENGDFVGGILENLAEMYNTIQGKLTDLNNFVKDLAATGLGEEGAIAALKSVSATPAVQKMAGSWVKNIMQKPLMMRAFLDGRAVGEWHLTVGNPMNPIAVIGNLCCDTTKITFSESLGIDDFPTEVTFKVTLKHGRQRAKQDILSMFNLGGGSMTLTDLSPPSSAFNSVGERNNIFQNALNNNLSIPDQTDIQNLVVSPQNVNGVVRGNTQSIINDIVVAGQGGGQFSVGNAISLTDSENLARIYGNRVRKAYGQGFASSKALVDYFRDLKTKD